MPAKSSCVVVLSLLVGCVAESDPVSPSDRSESGGTVVVTPQGTFGADEEVDVAASADGADEATVTLAPAAAGCSAVVQSSQSADWSELPNKQFHLTQHNVTIYNPSGTDCGFVEITWELDGDDRVGGSAVLDTTLHAHKTRRTWWTPNFDSRTDYPGRSHMWYDWVTVNANNYFDFIWCAIPGVDPAVGYAWCD